ncbi:MAG: glycosyltransferase family 2 protein [Mycobacterium sp.]|nr:glycosyltransferase family 2 protein [Mycobacterium sp.]
MSVDREVTVSAVVCAYTDARRELLNNSIESILAQLRPDDQLVVVIDYNDELLARVTEQYGARATVVPNRNSQGICGARNAGIEASRCDVVAFVDDDAEVQPGWLERLREDYRDPRVTGVGGNAQPVWPDERPAWFPETFNWVVGCSHEGLPVDRAPVRNLLGCNMSFRRDALDAVGGFNSEIGQVGANLMRCDETELCIRINQETTAPVLLLDPAVKVRHWVSDDRTTWKYFLRRCFWEGYSKRQLSTMVGPSDALSTERQYTVAVLPKALAREIVAGIRSPGRRSGHLGKSAAIVVGFAATAYGYLYATVKSWLPPQR